MKNYKRTAICIAALSVIFSVLLTGCAADKPPADEPADLSPDPSSDAPADAPADALGWNPQAEYENPDDFWEALAVADESDKTQEVAVEDAGDNEKTALAWMEAWFEMYKGLPGDNVANIAEGVVDRLEIVRVSKEDRPASFIAHITFSVRPTYPIEHNTFWMAGNTVQSPGRDGTWGQMTRWLELRLEDGGRYHFVQMTTGAIGDEEDYDTVA